MKFIYNLEEKEALLSAIIGNEKFNQYLKRYITWRIDKKNWIEYFS